MRDQARTTASSDAGQTIDRIRRVFHYAESQLMPSTPVALHEESSRRAMERAVQLKLF